jgi:Tol biopolymer transport system component
MRADGAGLHRPSKRTGVHEWSPALSDKSGELKWSPDGRRLVLSEGRSIYVIDRRGRERQLTHWLSDDDPQLSPDGRRVAFVRGRGVAVKSSSVYVMNVDGTGTRRLGAGVRSGWSPDGSSIAYVEERAVPSNDLIFVADPNGDAREVTTGNAPTWASDGRLAFMRYEYVYEDRGERGGAQWYVTSSKLFTARADGSNERLIAAFAADSEEGPIAATAPAWSPDGKTIGF